MTGATATHATDTNEKKSAEETFDDTFNQLFFGFRFADGIVGGFFLGAIDGDMHFLQT